MSSLEEKFKNISSLSRRERQQFMLDLKKIQPDFSKRILPWWQLHTRDCIVDVLIVADGSLNFGLGGPGLSEFLTIFRDLNNSPYKYKLTLAHRGTASQHQYVPGFLNDPNISDPNKQLSVQTLTGFKFDGPGVNLEKFDQIWLFGIQPSGAISLGEVNAINKYMDRGGGLFATGDHGYLGNAMCGAIQRVKDMRHWASTDPDNQLDQVSMRGRYRNDTNKPSPGQVSSTQFNNQSDNIPQVIFPVLSSNGKPHPLLSISKTVVPTGIISIMPDHPHEGECKPVTTFDGIPTQMVALSMVSAGNTASPSNKAATIPHAFNSIAVWDGYQVKKGRIVVDSTWHHFVNINLNGISSNPPYNGLSNSDLAVVKQYYKNISKWMNRKWDVHCAVVSTPLPIKISLSANLVESTLDNPSQKLEEVSLNDLNGIGILAEERLNQDFTPAVSREILLEWIGQRHSKFAKSLDVWRPKSMKEIEKLKQKGEHKGYYHEWINTDFVLYTAIGAGMMAMHADERFQKEETSEKDLPEMLRVFFDGISYGYEVAVKNFHQQVKEINGLLE